MPLQILDFLSLRTFSSVWYWLAVALLWGAASHRPMGVPYDMVWRALREGDEARASLDAVARPLARRMVNGLASGGALAVAVASAVLSALVVLSAVYRLEFAQGLLLILLPLGIVSWLSTGTARRIVGGEDPARHLRRLRLATNAVALVALSLTAFWGMYVNLAVSVL